jgi:sterol desaturase/sphingolipid hydroxylase (fatty acid hydroxylase superfamily)
MMHADKSRKVNTKGTKVLFKNPVVEKLSRTHVAVPITILSLYAAGMIYWILSNRLLDIIPVLGLFLTGLLLFTLVEYLIHRYVFHMDTDTSAKEKMQYAFHGVHHEYPKDKDRLAMPPLVSFTLATILLFGFKALMGWYGLAFLAGFLIGYSLYLFVHYIVHAWPPPKNALKVLWVNHGIHHYKDQERAFGVSSPLWDYLLGTLPKK